MSSNADKQLARIQKELAGYSSTLAIEFKRVAEEMSPAMGGPEFSQWAEAGLALAAQSWRSWEAATEYFRATPQLRLLLGPSGMAEWTQYGREITELSSALASSYFRASPETLPAITPPVLSRWVDLGRQLYKGTWRSASLSMQFFDASPNLFARLSIEEAARLVRFVDALCERSYDLASYCLSVAPDTLSPLAPDDREAFLAFAERMASTGWADARSYLEKGPTLLGHIHSDQRVRFLELAAEVAKQDGRQSYTHFSEAARALAAVDVDNHSQLLAMAEDLAPLSPVAAMEMLKHTPDILERIHIEDIEGFYIEGLNLLAASCERGEAYFRLETSHALEVLESLSHRVELHRVRDILTMYSKALTGTDVAIHSTEVLTEKNIGWINAEASSTEGTGVYLPLTIEDYEDKASNFSVYKVLATHQAGHLEFESFGFQFDRPSLLFDDLRPVLAAAHKPENGHEPLTDMEVFFDLFENRRMAADLFMICEDTRIDAMIDREYAGIRRVYQQAQLRELEKRPPLERMPLQQAFMENLVRASLGGFGHVRWHPGLGQVLPFLQEGISVLHILRQPEAMVEASAEAAARLYQLANQLPNVTLQLPDEDWYTLGDEMPSSGGEEYGEGGEPELSLDGEEAAYQSPHPVESRGDFKPELVQLLSKLRKNRSQPDGAEAAPSLADVQSALEKNVEIRPDDSVTGSAYQLPEELIANLLKELYSSEQAATERQDMQENAPGGQEQTAGQSSAGDESELAVQPTYSYYDEWDFRAGDYKPNWCRVLESPLAEGSAEAFDHILSRYSALAAQTRRQFEMLKPELFRKLKPLLDGEEFDLDAVVEYVVERRAGQLPQGKVYWRRNKVERDVAVAFLLDMSASTDEEIIRQERAHSPSQIRDMGSQIRDMGDPKRYFSWWMDRRAQEMLTQPKRIIDVEKESVVLLINALETIGDTYGIYGFSGYGRENVEFYVVKDMAEPFSARIKRRIDKITPVRSTRMGPAIRHTIGKLEKVNAKVRILFLVSDGRPQDHGYGRDRTEKEYAIHDTHMALLEARHKDIIPFCLTVDRFGHDYLKEMCEDVGYAVVPDIESLPNRMTTLYRRLTE